MTIRSLCLPLIGSTFTLTEDWEVELHWVKRNLVLLRKFNLTGMRDYVVGHRYERDPDTGTPLKDAAGSYIYTEVTRKETVPNPIFKDYDGNFAPAIITLLAGTEIWVSDIGGSWGGYVDLKITGGPDKRTKDRVLQVRFKAFNGAVADIAD